MTAFTKETEHYIEHEIQLRLHSELFQNNDKRYQDKFGSLEKRMDKMDFKLNFIITIMLGTVMLPAAMKYLHWL